MSNNSLFDENFFYQLDNFFSKLSGSFRRYTPLMIFLLLILLLLIFGQQLLLLIISGK